MPRTTRNSRRRPLFGILFNIVVTVLSFWFLWSILRDTGFEKVGRRLLDATPWIVAVTAAANIVRYMLLGVRWEILVRAEAPMGFRPILSILMAGNFLQLVAPGIRVAGPVLRAWYLSKETGRRRARFYGTIVADQTANFSIFVVAMAISGVLTAATGPRQSLAAGLGMVAALAGGLYLARRHFERIREGEPSLVRRAMGLVIHPRPEGEQVDEEGRPNPSLGERFVNWWDHLIEALIDSMVGKGTWWPAIGVSAALFVVLAWSMQLSFLAVGERITLAQAAFGVSAAAFVQILAAAPGGPGITEASLVLIFLTLGMDPASAAAGSLLSRLINYVVLIPWGGVCLWRLQRKYGAAPTSEDDGRASSGPPATSRAGVPALVLAIAMALAGLMASTGARAEETGGKTHLFTADRWYNTFSFAHPPALRIRPGDRVVTKTLDARGHDEHDRKVAPHWNPQIGPFYIEGAEPGDTLVVRLEKIRPNRASAWSNQVLDEYAVDPVFLRGASRQVTGSPCADPANPLCERWTLDLEKGVARTSSRDIEPGILELPFRPMLGCVGVAPPGKEAVATITPGEFGGNMDYFGMNEGVTVMLPVFEPGALLFLGDGHARQGEGEVVGNALEVSMDVEFSVDVLKNHRIGWPRIESPDAIMTLGSARPLLQALQHATTEMQAWLMAERGYDERGASLLMGHALEIEIANVVDPHFTVVARLPKDLLKLQPARGPR